ncbi:hypothetical protein GF336_02295 [Candidatus Woesearchaeota archaeon]|nr:hypothetical protein [Candidatus Woesearchaeota archaeon]
MVWFNSLFIIPNTETGISCLKDTVGVSSTHFTGVKKLPASFSTISGSTQM